MKITNEIVEEKAKALGFDLVGFAKAEILDEEAAHLEEWLGRGFQSGMKYMERNSEKRKDIRNVFPEAKSVISLVLNYYTPDQYNPKVSKDGNPNETNLSEDKINSSIREVSRSFDQSVIPTGKISRYAWGKDYHLIIWDKLKTLETQLSEIDPDFKSLSYVDTGPVMDKAWAVRAGLGWQGKHTNIINPDLGSWFFIANIITNYDFGYSEIITDHCGSCTACIDACPTHAIVDEYIIDSNKCISYLTIENKEEIPPEFKGKFDGWIFGCDICQDVCPWNIKFSEVCNIEEFRPAEGETEISLKSVIEMDEETFKRKYAVSPVKRTKLKGLRRNANFLLAEKNP